MGLFVSIRFINELHLFKYYLMKYLNVILLISLLASCGRNSEQVLEQGTYRASLSVQDNKMLPFIFEVDSPNTLRIFNADEVISVDEVTYKNDSVYIQTPVFEGYIVAKIYEDELRGYYIKESEERTVAFKATKESIRFPVSSQNASADVSGVWETVFSQHSEEDRYIAKGIFSQENTKVTGTFRTTTGDYRYLEGVVDGDSLKLSTFDGAHAFLFEAKVTDSTMTGIFYSGNHWKEPFTAKRNSNYELPSANDLTHLKEGYDRFAFNFEQAPGDFISLDDPQFKGKVVIVQVMGTWCPNCLDESKYYTSYIKEHPNANLAFVALAFEYAKTKELAFKRIKRLKDRIGIPYSILLAQYGGKDKKLAQEKLPMLDHVLSYPTSIYIDKKGNIRKIHTGFNGPATGQKYIDFQNEFEAFIAQLLKE